MSKLVIKNNINSELAITHVDNKPAKSIAGSDITVAVDTINDFPLIASDGDTVIVRDLNRGGTFIYDSSKITEHNDGTNFNGWIRQYDSAVNVKWFGAKGDGITDDRDAINNCFKHANSGDYISFSGLGTCAISSSIFIMADRNWETGFSSEDRNNITIDFGKTIIKFMDDVIFTGIFPDVPIYIKPIGYESTETRQHAMFIANLHNLTIKGGVFDGNMQTRGTTIGLPGQIEQEAAIKCIGCHNLVIENVVTQDTMGDGITIAAAYNDTGSGVSSFMNVNSLEAECRNISISNTRHYRHSRLGIALVACYKGILTNIYAEQIDSVTDYISLAGPGATIDCEYNSSQSYHTGAGFGRCENIEIINIKGKDNEYGGLLQILHGRNITVNGGHYTGKHNVSVIRTHYSINDGAKDCNISNIFIDGENVPSGITFRLGGERVTLSNCNIVNGHSYAPIGVDNEGSKDCVIDNIKFSNLFGSDITGSLIHLINAYNIKVKNVTFELANGSVVRTPVYISGTTDGTSILMDNIKLFGDLNNITVSKEGWGIINLDSTITNCTIKASNFDIQGKSRGLISGADISNKLYFSKSNIQALMHFPSALSLTLQSIDRVNVESMWNDGTTSSSCIHAECKDDTELSITNCNIHSEGAYGLNKVHTGAYFRAIPNTGSTFADLTTFKCTLSSINIYGGRESDGTFSTTHNDSSDSYDGTIITSDTARELFKTDKININNFNGKKITVASGASDQDVYNTSFGLNFNMLPNQHINVIPVEGKNQDYYIKEFIVNGYRSIAGFNITFLNDLTADQSFILNSI